MQTSRLRPTTIWMNETTGKGTPTAARAQNTFSPHCEFVQLTQEYYVFSKVMPHSLDSISAHSCTPPPALSSAMSRGDRLAVAPIENNCKWPRVCVFDASKVHGLTFFKNRFFSAHVKGYISATRPAFCDLFFPLDSLGHDDSIDTSFVSLCSRSQLTPSLMLRYNNLQVWDVARERNILFDRADSREFETCSNVRVAITVGEIMLFSSLKMSFRAISFSYLTNLMTYAQTLVCS